MRAKVDPSSALVPISAAAATLAVSSRFLSRLIAAGAVPSVSLGGVRRLRRDVVERLAREGLREEQRP